MNSRALSRGVLTAFILPTLVLGIMHGPEAQIQAIYAKHAGLPLIALATAVLLTRLFDAITYPLIGYLSDRSYARSGTRRNWTIAGTAVSMIGIWCLMRPPAAVTIWYFGAWTAVTYLGWKIIEIPMQAWSYGLSDDYAQRARVQAWRFFASMAGGVLFYATPYLAMKLGYSDGTELDFRSLGVAAALCVFALPLATTALILKVHEGHSAAPAAQQRFGVKDAVAAVRVNRPLLHLLAAFFTYNLFANLAGGISYFFIDTYLGLSQQYPAIMMLTLLATCLGIPFWTAVSSRHERHRAWAISLSLGGVGYMTLMFVTPGPVALPFMLVLSPASAFCLMGSVIALTMTADIVDYGKLHTGQDHGGLYGSMIAFLQKSLMSVSTAAGVGLVGFLGFDATAKVQTPEGIFGLKLVCSTLPAVGLFGAALIMWRYPLTRTRTAEVQQALAGRDRADQDTATI